VTVTIALILAVALPIAYLNSQSAEREVRDLEQIANGELANSKASEVEGLILGDIEKIRNVTNLLIQDFADEEQRRRALDPVFQRDLDLVHIEIYHLLDGRPKLFKSQTNSNYLKERELDPSYIERLHREKPLAIDDVFSGKTRLKIGTATLDPKAPLVSLGVPFLDQNNLVHHVAVAFFRLDQLQKVFALNSSRILYLVDIEGRVLAHSDDHLAVKSPSFAEVPIVAEALPIAVERVASAKTAVNGQGATTMSGQKARFLDPLTGQYFYGAYRVTAFGPTIISQIPEETILEPARKLRQSVYEVSGYALSGALFFVILLSISLTHPIEKLHEAHLLVAGGNLNIRAKVRSHDEVGQLARSFNHMVEGLLERDKIKNIFNKFHGSTVTEDLLKKGEMNLGGTRKDVTVLFSDIRDFTKFSEGHTPEEVVEMLNEYFQIMVTIITRNFGIVDKFVGDAIMAVWGAPKSSGNDSYYALRACLEMRQSLAELNQARLARGQSPIKIGIGLHSGPAISGTIGSSERMEYTVIGDTVNMASRIESSTKAFGSDLLVSASVVEGLDKHYMFEYAGAAEVKGKSEPIGMYKVRGYFDELGREVHIQTPYSDYEPGHADKVKVA
jgi:adenylate cyclase